MQLLRVDFSGDGMINIRLDDGTGFLPATGQWINGEIPAAIAYASGSIPAVDALLKLNCETIPDLVYVRGTGLDGINMPEQIAFPLHTGSDTLFYPINLATNPFAANIANYYSAFSITWEFSFDHEHWYPAGNSENPAYISCHFPVAENMAAGYGFYETYFYLSCRNAAGLSDTSEIISALFNEFTDQHVSNKNGDTLFYYKNIGCPYYTAPDLLKYKDGECSSWVKLFLSMLKVQGFSFVDDYISISENFTAADCGIVSGFLIKNWSFGTPAGTCSDLPYTNVWASPAYTDTSYLFAYSEVTDESGIQGQSAPNPASFFSTHIMAFINGMYYDPSYGIMYGSIDEFKANAIAGWYYSGIGDEMEIEIDVNGNGILDTTPNYNYMRITSDINFGEILTYQLSW